MENWYLEEQEGPAERRATGRIPVSRIIDSLDRYFATGDLVGAGRLLEYWEGEAVTLGDGEGRLTVLSEMMGFYRRSNNREKGLWAVSEGLRLISSLGRETMVSSATVYLNAATTMKAFGQAQAALPYYDKAEAIYKDSLPKTDALFGGLYNNRALAYADLGRYEEAEASYRQALDIMLHTPTGKPEAAITYINMAHLFEDLPQSAEKIKDCLEKAIALLHRPDVPENGYFAFVLSKCYPSLGYFGYTDAAAEFQKKSEEIYARN